MEPTTATLATITSILVLAAVAEALIEHLVKPILDTVAQDPPPEAGVDWRALALRYTAAVLAVLLCFMYRADLLVILGLHPPWPWAGYLITGLLIGRGSNFVHDFATRWLTPQDN